MGINFKILGSSSAGNSGLLEIEGAKILIDAGLSARKIMNQLSLQKMSIEELDAILHGLIEDEANVQEIASRGFDIDVVMRIWQMLDRAEYKRRQAPPGVKIGHRAFGRDRRYPITNSYKASYQINNN